MNSSSDPDSFSDEYTKNRDNLLTPHFKLVWLLNRSWVTNLTLDGSIYYHDQRSHYHKYNSYGSAQPSVHAQEQGYWMADTLPFTYYSDLINDSRELDYAASLKYDWLHHFGDMKSTLKAGVQWKADGNVGAGEYYEDPSLAANGYRPRPYTDYPYMHNLAVYLEEKITWCGTWTCAIPRLGIPGWHYSNEASHGIKIGGDANKLLTLAANVRATGDIYWDDANTQRQPFYALLGASLTWQQKRYSLQLWGRNLTDTGYKTFYFVSIQHPFLQRGHGRSLGATVRISL